MAKSELSTPLTNDDHHEDHSHDHGDQPATGIKRWLFATNHKDIGTMYLVFSLVMFFIGGAMAMVIRAELFQPGLQLVDPVFFNQMTTNHALVMIFGAVMPAFVGLANWMIHCKSAARHALPAHETISGFWILPFAFILDVVHAVRTWRNGRRRLACTALVLADRRWLSMLIFAIHMMGASSIMGAINVIVTIMNMRAPGMNLLKMPLFCWSWLITAYLLIAVMPCWPAPVTMPADRSFLKNQFLQCGGRRDPVMFEHIFWFFGHLRSTS